MKKINISSRKENTREKKTSDLIKEELKKIFLEFSNNLNSIQRKFVVADELVNLKRLDESKDVFRTQIVFLESALDYYIHRLSSFAMIQMSEGNWKKTNSYKNLNIPIEKVLKGLSNPEDLGWLKESIIVHHSSNTYMSSKEIKKQLSLMVEKTLFKSIADKLYYEQGSAEKTVEKLENMLNDVFTRRNQIAHQSDRDHFTGERYEIDKETTEFYLNEVGRFAESLYEELIKRIDSGE
ncbi:MAG TPA: HEPN domain-containing protein [Thermotogota bacterium]|nr:HEPN domain-containing protein [Thermotogota bacterium]HPJ88662.1 HEPN domain-containing protein [Thermotogota bacterium]HPR95800.1 HEPN domain-containing protein [Thermotogota bacterium]